MMRIERRRLRWRFAGPGLTTEQALGHEIPLRPAPQLHPSGEAGILIRAEDDSLVELDRPGARRVSRKRAGRDDQKRDNEQPNYGTRGDHDN
jgi:hypothetical protein